MPPLPSTPMPIRKRKLASSLAQVKIILWKNLLLYKNNKLGIFFELLFLAFSLILIFLAHYSIEMKRLPTSPLRLAELYVVGSVDVSKSFPNSIYYYPNNEFIKSLMKTLPNTNMVDLIGVNHSNPEDFIDYNKTRSETIWMVSFPNDYDSFHAVNESFSYSILTVDR